MRYDERLKELLQTFFAEFMESFFPEFAARLDLTRVSFLNKEAFTAIGSGGPQIMDLVAETPLKDGSGSEMVLILVELAGRRRPLTPKQLYDYYALLRRDHQLPVIPILVYVTGGKGKERWEEYREGAVGFSFVIFQYPRLRLRSLKAAEHARSGSPLECALAPLMDRRGTDLPALKIASMEGIARGGLPGGKAWLLSNFVNTYLPLSGEAEEQYQALLGQEEHQMAKLIDYETWVAQNEARGEARGRATGHVEAKREDIIAVLETRFAPVPEEWVQRVETMDSLPQLNSLFRQLLAVDSRDEVGRAMLG
jgi:hypothetical protein